MKMQWMVSVLISSLLILSGCSEKPDQALGTLEWDRVNGRAIASETIVEIYVKEGDWVTKNQPLLALDSRMQQAHVSRAAGAVKQAEWRLNQLISGYREEEVATARAELEAAKVALNTRKTEYERQQDVFKKGLTSKRNLDESKNLYTQAVGKEKTSQENLNRLLAGYREEEIEQARAKLDAANSELKYQQELLNRYTIKAQRSGLLDSLPFKLGDKPPTGAVLSTVLAGEMPWARVYMPEGWLSSVAVGDEVTVFFDGISNPYTGKIRHIESDASFTPYYSLSEQNRKRLSYVSEIDIVGGEARKLPVGIPVQVELRGD